jgi:hypothetical protein
MDCDCYDCDECVEAAEKKARRLLHSHLTSYQRRMLAKDDRITARGNVTGDRYFIFATREAWVSRVRDGRGYCLEIIDDGDEEATPMWDQMLAKKIIIEADEQLFLDTACPSGGEDD